MKFRKTLAVPAIALLMSTAALAQTTPDPVVEGIVSDLSGSGYSGIEIRRSATRYRAEATGAAGKLERTYSIDGTLMKEELKAGGKEIERTFDAQGNVVKEEIDDYDDESLEDEDEGEDENEAEDDDSNDDDSDSDSDDDEGDDS
ncbi:MULTISPECIES: hypothetical protein [Actibacterium]|uniref:Phosphopantothenoylcysteine synthetase/decarboxylase n=1 Tax=Actibacterium naphthalenivorans TaxID=1614693 RepID=A0A840C748_9RHOB|nr:MULTISPECIES: hypothetical protein [Actibacterium]MBB4020900.1 phosphopantothenoylcysteine synthetase/decarboxylase [Actibacterium naphthalenivorans]